jgi:hypothetical protein
MSKFFWHFLVNKYTTNALSKKPPKRWNLKLKRGFQFPKYLPFIQSKSDKENEFSFIFVLMKYKRNFHQKPLKKIKQFLNFTFPFNISIILIDQKKLLKFKVSAAIWSAWYYSRQNVYRVSIENFNQKLQSNQKRSNILLKLISWQRL